MSQAVMTSKPDSASTASSSLRKAGSPSTTRTLRFESMLSTKLLSDERTERRLQIEQPAELVRKGLPGRRAGSISRPAAYCVCPSDPWISEVAFGSDRRVLRYPPASGGP